MASATEERARRVHAINKSACSEIASATEERARQAHAISNRACSEIASATEECARRIRAISKRACSESAPSTVKHARQVHAVSNERMAHVLYVPSDRRASTVRSFFMRPLRSSGRLWWWRQRRRLSAVTLPMGAGDYVRPAWGLRSPVGSSGSGPSGYFGLAPLGSGARDIQSSVWSGRYFRLGPDWPRLQTQRRRVAIAINLHTTVVVWTSPRPPARQPSAHPPARHPALPPARSPNQRPALPSRYPPNELR